MSDYLWAEPYPELYKICNLFNMTHLMYPIKFVYQSLNPYLQDGPQCGLVALAMCSLNSNKEFVDRLKQDAVELGYSCNGEMFSALNMCNLAKKCMPEKQIKMYDGYLMNDFIVNFLLEGGLMLVPYDSDKNHCPCSRKGHNAHWAVISGIIITHSDNFVLARHGKSKNLSIWKLIELADSNAQLEEFSPDRKLSGVNYLLPEGGIDGQFGLNCKSVLIYS